MKNKTKSHREVAIEFAEYLTKNAKLLENGKWKTEEVLGGIYDVYSEYCLEAGICTSCGSFDGRVVEDPFAAEIYDAYVEDCLCDNCYRERVYDI